MFRLTLCTLLIALSVAQGQNNTVCVDLVIPPSIGGNDLPPSTQVIDTNDGRLLVLRLPGLVQTYNSSTYAPLDAQGPFLSIPTFVSDETGAIGMAIHPNFTSNKKFYVYYSCLMNATTNPSCFAYCEDDDWCNGGSCNTTTNVCNTEWTFVLDEFVAGNTSASFSKRITTVAFRPGINGGGISFLPNGYLILGVGDGALANDTYLNAQNINRTAGKLLVFDVDTPNPNPKPGHNSTVPSSNPFVGKTKFPEIYALGLRQPYRFTNFFGIFAVGEVGENQYEEFDEVIAGANYGWSAYEGPSNFRTEVNVTTGNLTFPIKNISHNLFPDASAGIALIAGFLYTGSDSCLRNQYVFGDFGGLVLSYANNSQVNPTLGTFKCASNSTFNCSDTAPKNTLSVDQDFKGEIYFSTFSGIYRTVSSTRCNIQCTSDSFLSAAPEGTSPSSTSTSFTSFGERVESSWAIVLLLSLLGFLV